MFKLLKHLKKFSISILLIIILLVIQAFCDLSLPQYTSNIVNIGIQQNGIENSVPKVIREEQYNNLKLFLSDNDKKLLDENYKILEKKNVGESEYSKYVKDFPKVENEKVYALSTDNEENINKLNVALGKAESVLSTIEDKEKSKAIKGEIVKQMPQGAILPENISLLEIFKSMPQQQSKEMLSQISKKFEDMPETMITQMGSIFVKGEYKALGANIDSMQNSYILKSGGLMILIALVSMVVSVVVVFIAARVAAGLGHGLRKNVFGKVIGFSNTELDKFSIASLITRSTNDIQQIQLLIVMLLRIVFYAPILAIGGVIKVLNTETSMTWIIGVAVAAILTVVITLFSIVLPRFKKLQSLVDRVNLVMREILSGILVIRAFGTNKHEEKRFDKANTDLTKTNLFVNRIMTFMMPMMMLIMNAVTVLIVYVGAKNIDSGTIQVGDMMAFIQYTMQIIMSFLLISMISIMLPRATVSLGRIDEVLNTSLSIEDPSEAKKFKEEKKGLLEFKNVSFKYPEAEEFAIKNITFKAKPGETTAIIGSTGCGKSTLVNLIPRFYDVTNGEILLDGLNVKDVSQHDLREKIGYVPQKGVLFTGTIESNIKYGAENASIDDIKKAAEIAQATEFIDSKEKGYETPISQGGTNVSGGQKQRLSIARAIAKKPDVYIFDDSFSALDYKTDSALRSALKKGTENATVLIVAQRISTILNAEQIIVLDKGEIVGKGTHKELVENCEVYREIAKSQLSKEEM